MPNELIVNTAMVCYLCRRVALIRLQGWTDLAPIRKEKEALQVFFVTCVVCLSFPNSHDAATARIPKYVDMGGYRTTIEPTMYIFACSPQGCNEKKLSIGLSIGIFRIKDFTKVKDSDELFTPFIPNANIMILKDGCEQTTDCRFFKHERVDTDRQILRYPEDSKTYDFSQFPFASVANRPPIYVAPILCPRCLADISPPRYSGSDDDNSDMVKLLD